MVRKPQLGGVVPAVLTPFNEDLSIDEGALQLLLTGSAPFAGSGLFFSQGNPGRWGLRSLPRERRIEN